jgi:DNA repair exonuclease SbcCD nuclease subunit
MSRVIFTADIHFGVTGRLQDILFACRVMREYAKKAKIDTVVVLGDLFHDRQSLGIDVLNAACKFFEETKEQYGQQWIVFPGNHDLFLKHSWEITSLVPMRRHLTVIDDVKTLMLDDQRFIVLPFITYEKSYMKVLRRIAERCEPTDKLLTHIGVNGSTLNTCFLLKDWSIVSFEDMPFERVYTGHFHSKQRVGNVYYPGSPIPFKFDEGDVAHGFYVYDTEENDHKFINIWKAAAKLIPDEVAPPQFCTILDEQLEGLEQSDVSNNMIRVALQKEYTDHEKNEIKGRLHEMGARRVRWMDLNKSDIEKNEQITANFETKDLFRAWTQKDEKGVKDLDVGLLNKLHDEVAQEGDEIYALEEIGST